jgi:hypothetical protein
LSDTPFSGELEASGELLLWWDGYIQVAAYLSAQARYNFRMPGNCRREVLPRVDVNRVPRAFAQQSASKTVQVLQELAAFHFTTGV